MLKVRLEGIEEAKALLTPKQYERAMRATVNDLAGTIRTQTAKAIKRRYTLPAARVKEGIVVRKARQDMTASITYTGRPPGLQHFKARQVRKSGGVAYSLQMGKHGMTGRRLRRGSPSGVTVEVVKGRRKPVSRGFMAVMPGGGVGVWKRKGKKRLPIKRLHGPSIKGMFRRTGGMRRARLIVNKELSKKFMRNVRRYA